MGAKQSKRSVDISGKEAESAGEVAAAGAGGEGRVEQLADADALKPQLNGDAHITEPSDKEKQIDSGTPENEKDATTEKENKEQEDEKKESVPVTNGDSEPKAENGETLSSPEENKKPKKEKVKKKWSLRSISFSRKDKPKQEKKQKDEDKTNGEPEKVPEEVAEATAEADKNEVAQEEKTPTDVKQDKTPETPVTEPITNGSSTPETPKLETPVEETVEPKTEIAKPEPKLEPEQLPVNGLSLEETQNNVSETIINESSKPEEITVESLVPATEIPVKNEVCVKQMPLIEPTPPPLPATPPPSSVASFAATTMAPELTDASLANTAHILTDSTAVLDINTDITVKEVINEVQQLNIQSKDELITKPVTPNEIPSEAVNCPMKESKKSVEESTTTISNDPEDLSNHKELKDQDHDNLIESMKVENVTTDNKDIVKELDNLPLPADNQNDTKTEEVNTEDIKHNECIINEVPTSVDAELNASENDDTEIENLKNKSKDSQANLIKTTECNGDLKKDTIVMNGDSVIDVHVESPKQVTTPEDSMPPSLSEAMESLPACGEDVVSNDASESFPLPPSELCPSESEISQPGTPEQNGDAPTNPTQESLLASDKMADLIPEVPVIPELNTELETTTDVEVAN